MKTKQTKKTAKKKIRRKPHRDLAEIAAELDGGLKKLRLTKVEIGRLLIEAKSILPHGQWEDWVVARGLTKKTALNYRTLAESVKIADLKDGQDVKYREAGMLADLTESYETPDTGVVKVAEPVAKQAATHAFVAWVNSSRKLADDGAAAESFPQEVREMAPNERVLFIAKFERDVVWAQELLAIAKEANETDGQDDEIRTKKIA